MTTQRNDNSGRVRSCWGQNVLSWTKKDGKNIFTLKLAQKPWKVSTWEQQRKQFITYSGNQGQLNLNKQRRSYRNFVSYPATIALSIKSYLLKHQLWYFIAVHCSRRIFYINGFRPCHGDFTMSMILIWGEGPAGEWVRPRHITWLSPAIESWKSFHPVCSGQYRQKKDHRRSLYGRYLYCANILRKWYTQCMPLGGITDECTTYGGTKTRKIATI